MSLEQLPVTKEPTVMTFTTIKCAAKQTCHQVYRISNTFAKVEINSLTFSGWDVPSCLYGGISFHDAHKMAESEEIRFTEIYSLCTNRTNKIRLKSLNHTNSSKPHEDAHSYYTASKQTLIVVHSRPHDLLEVNLRISASECRGVFVNPCLERKYFEIVAFPSVYKDKVLHYDYPFGDTRDDTPCLAVQISLKYLFTDQSYDDDVLRYGCKKGFVMKQNNLKWCGAKFQYFQLHQSPKYFAIQYHYPDFFPENHFGSQDTDVLLFANKVSGDSLVLRDKQEFQCRENIQNPNGFKRYTQKIVEESEWYRGVKIYNTSERHQENSVLHMEADINFIRTQKQMEDLFHMTVQPLSDSISILIFRYQECEALLPMQLQEGSTSFISKMANISICVREPVRGVMDGNMVLELSLVSGVPHRNFSLGTISVHSNLCLDTSWLRELFYIDVYTRDPEFTRCNEIQQNSGEDQLIWKSTLNSEQFLLTGNKFMFFVPGKIFDAEINLDPNSIYEQEKIAIKYRWTTRPDKRVFRHDISTFSGTGSGYAFTSFRLQGNYFNLQHHKFFVLTRNIRGDYGQPGPVTWYGADRKCKNKEAHLPSMTSNQDVEDLMSFLRSLSFSALVTNIFIGIHRKVELSVATV